MNQELLDRLGSLADKADNFTFSVKLPGLPDSLHVEALAGGMEEIRDLLREIYVEESGANPWAE